jgi:anti-sigma B factor antagonist
LKLTITIERKKNKSELVKLSGIMNAETIHEFREHIVRISQSNLNLIVLDLEMLEEIDSSGVGAIISLLKHLRLKNGELRILKIRGAVKKLFELLQIDRGLDIYENVEQAFPA